MLGSFILEILLMIGASGENYGTTEFSMLWLIKLHQLSLDPGLGLTEAATSSQLAQSDIECELV